MNKVEIYNDKTGEISSLLKKDKNKLTPRQFEILNFALNYTSTWKKKYKIVKIIAKQFDISITVARRHINNIVKKIDWLDTYVWVFTEKTLNSLGNPNHSRSLTLQILKKKLVVKLKALYKSFKHLYLKKGAFFTNFKKFRIQNILYKLLINNKNKPNYFFNFFRLGPIYKYEWNEYLWKNKSKIKQKILKT